jgi:hypothetical protein
MVDFLVDKDCLLYRVCVQSSAQVHATHASTGDDASAPP